MYRFVLRSSLAKNVSKAFNLTIDKLYNNLEYQRSTWEGIMSTQSEQPKKHKGVSGVAIPAGLFIGMGVGFLVGNIVAGIFLGLGVGFLIMIIVRAKLGEW